MSSVTAFKSSKGKCIWRLFGGDECEPFCADEIDSGRQSLRAYSTAGYTHFSRSTLLCCCNELQLCLATRLSCVKVLCLPLLDLAAKWMSIALFGLPFFGFEGLPRGWLHDVRGRRAKAWILSGHNPDTFPSIFSVRSAPLVLLSALLSPLRPRRRSSHPCFPFAPLGPEGFLILTLGDPDSLPVLPTKHQLHLLSSFSRPLLPSP